MRELTIKWAIDVRTLEGWQYNYADEYFDDRASAMEWVETYRPYIGASSINYRTIEVLA
jgi:hypothetical protein